MSSSTKIIIPAVLLILLIVIIVPIIIVATSLGGFISKGTGSGGSGRGCTISDQSFSDVSITADTIVLSSGKSAAQTLEDKYSNAATNDQYVRQVFARGAKEGINPLMALATWAGEQTFSHPEKAFGYGYKDSGTIAGVTAWDTQLNGVYHALNQAKSASGYYTDPSGTDSFTRFYYNYTTAMKNAYSQAGNMWNLNDDPVSARLGVFKLLAPQMIHCQQNSSIVAGKGNNGVPLLKQANYTQFYGQTTHKISDAGCCVVAAAMVLDYYGFNVDPVAIGNFSYDHKCYSGNGTDTACLFKALAGKYDGLTYKDIGNNWDQAISYLQAGKPLLAHGKGSAPFTKGGHCIVITGYDSNTKMFNINNPANTGDGPYSQSQLTAAHITGMYYLGQ